MRGSFILVAWFFILSAHAQEYRFHQYRVEQGLPSDVIKAVTEDSLGFLWIASDDGLVKYDGIKFTTYKSALRSQFSKGFLHTKDGRLLAFSDLDLVEIQNNVDTVIFRTIIRGERFLTDSTLHYVKSIYQDRDENIWMGEPKSIIRFDGKKLRRYDFGEENRSPVFVRSFSFFENDKGEFFTIAYNGNVFRYDPAKDKFEKLLYSLPEEVSHVLFANGTLHVAARGGLFKAVVTRNEIHLQYGMLQVPGISFLNVTPDSTLLVSTYGDDMFEFNPRSEKWQTFAYHFNGINTCYVSREGDYWVSTDKGLVLVQKNLFKLADRNSSAQFIEAITMDESSGDVYFATKETLVRLIPNKEGWERHEMVRDKANYFQSLQFTRNGLWASTNWKVLLLRNERILRTWDFSGQGNFVHHLFLDSKENLWISQAGSPVIRYIDPTFKIKTFRVDGIDQNEINHIEEGQDGIYAVANGLTSYIFFKAHNDSIFRNISIPVSFDVRGDFTVVNAGIQNGIIWLASSEGLLRFDRNELKRANHGEAFERFPVSCVTVLNDEQLLFSNSFGLFRYNAVTGEYWLYDEDSGLPSNTITDHGIFVSGKDDIWIGTSYGIATATADFAHTKLTRRPYCVEARINGTPKRFHDGLKADFGSYVTLQFSPVSFPENKIDYQWKMDDETQWKTLNNGLLSFSTMEEGAHTVYVRAKKNTGLSWSEPTKFLLEINPPYWKSAQFLFLVFLLVIIIAWASYAISAAILSQRRRYLELQINERTQELKRANEELTIRNTELDRFVYSASHDLSAPLKSILGLIRVAKLDQPTEVHRQYLDMMERSVHKLENFIGEVVTYSRNTRMPIKLDRFDFTAFVQNLLQDHEYSPNFKFIDFRIQDNTGEEMVSDLTRMKIIMNNLISNAIKFHWIENGRKPYVEIALDKRNDQYIIRVKDNGRGISENHIKKIFEMFYRATDEAQGSGLGLYILKEAVVKLGGTVEAVSAVEVGTEFTITVPVPAKESILTA
jgi:signal transduction histidine kinase